MTYTLPSSGLVLDLDADTISGADGDPVASWTDGSGQGNTVTQATSGNQPILKLSQINGHKAVRFTGGSAHNLTKSSPTGLSNTVGTCVFIAKPSSTTGVQRFVSYGSGSGNGYGFGGSSGQMAVTTYGVKDYTAARGYNTSAWTAFQYELKSDFSVMYLRDVRWPKRAATHTSGPNSGANTLAIGGRMPNAVDYYSGDVSRVLMWNRELTDAELRTVGGWIFQNYGIVQGTLYNANAAQTTPSVDSWPNSGTAIESSVYVKADRSTTFGYVYWLAFVPLPNAQVSQENPHILTSSDGVTWGVPTGGSNPVVAYPGGGASGNNADPYLMMAQDGKFYLFYIRESGTGVNGVYVKDSSDGVTWSSERKIIAVTSGNDVLEPKVMWDGSRYVMYTVNANLSPNRFQRRTCSTPDGTWSSATDVTCVIPGSRAPWHFDASIIGSQFVFGFSDNDSARNLWVAASNVSDGLTFTCGESPVVASGAGSWDDDNMYRLVLRLDAAGTGLQAWYNGQLASSSIGWHQGYTTSIPLTEIPTAATATFAPTYDRTGRRRPLLVR